MKYLTQYLTLVAILFFGCGDHDRNNPLSASETPTSLEKLTLNSTASTVADATAFALSAEDNVSIILVDRKGQPVPSGRMEMSVTRDSWFVGRFLGDSGAISMSVDFAPGNFVHDNPATNMGYEVVNFDDFFLFAENFGRTQSNPSWEERFDLDNNGEVEFQDFFVFADYFGQNDLPPTAAKVVAMQEVSKEEFDERTENLKKFLTESQITQIWTTLTRRAKVAASEPEYLYHAHSLEKIFADQDTVVVGMLTGSKKFQISVNAAPRPASLLLEAKLSIVLGDTVRVSMAQYFETDDSLRFAVDSSRTVLPWAIENDTTLVIIPVGIATTSIVMQATDPVGQSAEYPISIEVLPPVVLPDTLAPTLTLSVDSTTVHYSNNESESLPVNFTLTVGDSVSVGSSTDSLSVGTSRYDFLPPGRYGVLFVATDSSGNTAELRDSLIVLPPPVIDLPPSIVLRFDRYTSAPAEGRGIDVRTDVSDESSIPRTVRVSTTSNDGGEINIDIKLEATEPNSGYGYGTISVPANQTMSAILWTSIVSVTDSIGQTSSDTLQFTQAGRTEPLPPPPPPPPPPVVVVTPPPVVHTASEARLNNAAPGTTFQLDSGTALNCSAPLSGTWSFGGQSVTGTSASFTAANGTLSFTANGVTVTWNIQATPPGLDP